MKYPAASRGALVLLSMCAALCVPTRTSGAELSVSPTRIDLGPASGSAALTLINQGASPVTVQAGVVGWTRRGAEDIHRETPEVIVSPAMATIAPGDSQLIRVMRRGPGSASEEKAFRVILDEIPTLPSREEKRVVFRTRMVIPVFDKPVSLAPRMSWRLARSGVDYVLQGRNDGDAHILVSRLEFELPDSGSRAVARLDYLFPGQSLEVRTSAFHPTPSGRARIRVTTDVGPMQLDLPIE